MINEQIKKFLSKENDYRKLFETDLGKKVLKDLMHHAHVLDTTFSKDPYETAYKEGMRHMVLVIFNRVNKDHSKLIEMLNEEKENDRPGTKYFGGNNTVHTFND